MRAKCYVCGRKSKSQNKKVGRGRRRCSFTHLQIKCKRHILIPELTVAYRKCAKCGKTEKEIKKEKRG